MMELQDLQAAWQSATQKLETQTLRLAELEGHALRHRVHGRLGLVSLGQWIELAVGIAIAVWAGGYWFDHLGTPHLVAYGVAVHLYGIALIAMATTQLVKLAAIDWTQPVAQVHARVLDVRRQRIRGERVLLLVGAIAWAPLLFIGLNAIGLDVWRYQPMYVLANLAFGAVLAIAAAWAMRRWPSWLETSAVGGRLQQVERELRDAREFTQG
ncbi:hypothetical protein LYSHEL_19380 [Lysobacter helvus]|uniref:Serine/threonine protein kinase n=2 Tax=Lysobacteraceae TaxID=32033 RepID=A0ABM7Q6C2_9GAMM|nr:MULTISPECIES: hypothetical protein [Lysobacter]BCT92915.1 hypothetical protein LYSCAS_19390 [Lysobacter caseinilyticus]BCT96067.1 hypothetical protein LYSHEL_19380 [Lysobacter helvus]